MSKHVNLDTIEDIKAIAVYAKNVSLKHIDNLMMYKQGTNSMLIDLYAKQYFNELHKRLTAKEKVYKVYFADLKTMQEVLNHEYAQSDRTTLSSDEQEYKDTLTSAIASLSILLTKMEIKIEEIIERMGEKS